MSEYDDLDTAAGRRRAERWQQAEAVARQSHASEAPQRALQKEMTAALIADFERRDRDRKQGRRNEMTSEVAKPFNIDGDDLDQVNAQLDSGDKLSVDVFRSEVELTLYDENCDASFTVVFTSEEARNIGRLLMHAGDYITARNETVAK